MKKTGKTNVKSPKLRLQPEAIRLLSATVLHDVQGGRGASDGPCPTTCGKVTCAGNA